ncbi:MAG: MarR family transcriptional regulator [Steroidobacteraceae bacterium]
MRRKKSEQPAVRGHATSLGPLASYIAFQLRRAQNMSFEAFANRVGKSNLAPGHFAILAVIDANHGINQTALSRATDRDKSTLTPAIRTLMNSGYVARVRSAADSRAYELSLTRAGKRYLDQLRAHAEAHDRRLDEIVGPAHKALLLHLLRQIVLGLEKDRKSKR